MTIRQYYLACLSHASYMITDDATKTAAVVDPQRDVDQYLADAKAGGHTIRHVFLTHFHADFIAGRIGFDNVAGYLAGGMNALAARDDLVERTERITAPALAEWLAGKRPDAGATPTIGDVRSEAEYAGGHIEGPQHPAHAS